jgi:hypothetical protein
LAETERKFIEECFFATADLQNESEEGDGLGTLWLELLKEFDLYDPNEWE